MKSFTTAFAVLGLASSAFACGDDVAHAHTHEHSKRLAPQVPLTPPSSPLQWGDINVIHTTDSHGWLLGHQKSAFPEPNYSGDFGDFASFVEHMKEIAFLRGVDLLLVDSGDLHDGTGLSDGGPPGSVDAHDSNKFFSQLPYDLLAIGNHELYIYNNTLDMYKNFAPRFPGRYLSSNVNITVPTLDGKNQSVPVGSRFAKFQTLFGRKVTSLGVLYDFTGNDAGTTVQPVASMVNETWFKEAIAEEPDFFLLAGHMPVSKDNWPVVHQAIRAVHPYTPIMIFGGHTHIRDCQMLDGRTMALESGRYMETVGWMSMNLPTKKTPTSQNVTFSRRYLDPNRVTYEFHTTQSNRTFDTFGGQFITAGLELLSKAFNLAYTYGTAPRDFTLSRDPYPSAGSVLSLLASNATPVALAQNNSRAATTPHYVVVNSGAIRFDLYSGPFTKNDQVVVSPFTDGFLYIPGVLASVAEQVLPLLNHYGSDKRDLESAREADLYARGWVGSRYNNWLARQAVEEGALERRAAGNLTLGYVTKDGCPGVGDDTAHAPMPYYDAPDYIASAFPNVSASTPIDLVFVDFIESDVVSLLNKAQNATKYTTADVKTYSPLLINEVLGVYAQVAWK